MGTWGGARPGAGRRRLDKKNAKPAVDAGASAPKTAGRMAVSRGVAMQVVEASEQYAKQRTRRPQFNPFQLPIFPPKATPPKRFQMAMDESMDWAGTQWAGGIMANVAAEGLMFLGYPYLAELAQRPEYRVISETIATEMTRKWIKFSGVGDEDKSEKIRELNDFLDYLKVRDRFADLAAQDGFFGRSHLFLDDGNEGTNDDELKTPIGDGRDALVGKKIGKGWLKALRTVEAVWTYPTTYNAVNPLRPDWYNPQVWYVMGKQIHRTRLMTFIGREVPDLLKPAYSFGGLSLSQMAKPYVDIWLTTRQSVADLIHSFSVMVLMTDLETILQPGRADGLIARAAMFNALRDNQGLMMVNKATEDFKNVSASMAGLHELQAQAQEHMASVARIPLVKFTGISPSGLNASSEGEMRAFYDTIAAYQNKFFRPNLNTVVDIAQVTLWGAADQDITYEFVPLWELSEKEKGEKRKAEAETAQIDIDTGAISPQERRTVLVNDPESPYQGLDPEDVPDLRGEEEEGLEPEGGRPQPLSEAGPELGAQPDKGGEGGGQDAQILPFGGGPLAGDADFRESDHPRAPDGKFGSGGGGGKTATGGKSSAHEAASSYKEHAAVNEWLRGDRSAAAGSKAENEKIVSGMDNLIASNKLKEPKVLYRGLGDQSLVDKITSNGSISDKAFFSTSTDPAIAREHADGGYVMKVEIPAGVHAYEYPADDPQKEIVLPRGSKFKINGIDHINKTVSFKLEGAPAERQGFQAPQFGLNHPARFSFQDWKESLPPQSSGEPDHADSVVVFGFEDSPKVKELNGKALKAWEPPADWSEVDGQDATNEPPVPDLPKGMQLSSGVIIMEPDGRVWLTRPRNGFGGYNQTFPKGRAEEGLSLQANAIKEAYEETGLKARIMGFVGDYEGDTTVTRFYVATRDGGDPADAGEESEGVVLSPPDKLKEFLNRKRDREIAALIGDEATFEESKHPRDNEGKFSSTGGGGSGAKKGKAAAAKSSPAVKAAYQQALKDNPKVAALLKKVNDPVSHGAPISMAKMDKVGKQMGSNPGGVYQAPTGEKYYIKQAQTEDHVVNELLAAKLFALTGSPTLKYTPVEGMKHVATELQKLDKNNVSQLSPEEKKQAQADFATHAWLANYDSAGTGGDNVGVVNGKVTPLDFGGALKYRAQGKPKGEAFGDKVTETESMLDPGKAPDAAALYGSMTPEEMKASAQKVANIPNEAIADAVASMGMGTGETDALIAKLLARKGDLMKQFDVKPEGGEGGEGEGEEGNSEFEAKHERDASGKFKKMAEKITNKYGEGGSFESADEKLAAALETGVSLEELNGMLSPTEKYELEKYYGGEGVAGMIAAKEIPSPLSNEPTGSTEAAAEKPKKTAFGGLWKEGGSDDKANLVLNVNHVLGKPANAGQSYRQMLTFMIKKAQEPGAQDVVNQYAVNDLKTKLAESLFKAQAKAIQAGNQAEANKIGKALEKIQEKEPDITAAAWKVLGGAPEKKAAPKPAPKAEEPPVSKKSDFPSPNVITHKGLEKPPTEAEITKAKKTVPLKLEYVPGAPQGSKDAQKLVDKFNEKYANKAVNSKEEIEAKIADFKDMQAAMVPLMSEQQKKDAKLAAEKAEMAAQAAAEQKKAAAAEAAKLAEEMNDPAVKKQYDTLQEIFSGHMTGYAESSKKVIKQHNLNITPYDGAFIQAYVGSSYSALNEQLRKTKITAEQYKYAKALDTALSKMPVYTGKCHRGIKGLSAAEADKYQPGHIVIENQFNSAGKKSKLWGDWTFEITSKNGRDISSFNPNEGGGEIVFRMNTHFVVKSRVGKKIVMEEVDD